MSERSFHPPVWDRGEPIDEGMLAFTIGEDWRMDQRLVAYDITGSLAHAAGLLEAGCAFYIRAIGACLESLELQGVTT